MIPQVRLIHAVCGHNLRFGCIRLSKFLIDPMDRLIFSINYGRSGSHYLSKIFEGVESCYAAHEPDPICNGLAMRRFHNGEASELAFLARRKIDLIENVLQSHRVYFESNHCFIKGFGWILADLIPAHRLGIVVLRRNKDAVVASLARVGCSPLSRLGTEWILTPSIHNPIIQPPRLFAWLSAQSSWRAACLFHKLFVAIGLVGRFIPGIETKRPACLDKYELAALYWYLEEVDALEREFRRMHPDIACFDVDIDELNSAEKIHEMLDFFNLIASPSLAGQIGEPSNRKAFHS